MHDTLVARAAGRDNNVGTLQFLAALLVIYSHAFPIGQNSNAGEIMMQITRSQLSCGTTAVFVFFLLSGYLVSASFAHSGSLCNYLKKRALRLFPALLLVLLFSTFVLGPIFTTLPLGEYIRSSETRQYLKSFFLYPVYWNLPGVFTENVYSASVNGAIWTIPYQFGLYLSLGIIGALGLLESRRCSAVMLLLCALFYQYSGTLLPELTHFMLMPVEDWFKLGMYFYAGVCAYTWRDRIRLRGRTALLCLFLLAVFILHFRRPALGLALFGSYLVFWLCFGIRQLRLPLPNISYEIYLFGFPIQQAVTAAFGGAMNPYLNMALSIPIVLVLTWLAERFIERPLLHRLSRRPAAAN